MMDVSTLLKRGVQAYCRVGLILRILVGMTIGVVLALLAPSWTAVGALGELFVGMLRALAPALVFMLVVASLSQKEGKLDSRFGLVVFLYLLSTLVASIIAVSASYLFPQTLALAEAEEGSAPVSLVSVLWNLLSSITTSPITAITEAHYFSILFWACCMGLALKRVGTDATKQVVLDFSRVLSSLVRGVIQTAPFGVMGLVFTSVSTSGTEIFSVYGKLTLLLVGCMLFVALVANPLIVFCVLKRNPYPLVLRCLRESGTTAFFTRSSAANIPVNMALCEKLGLDRDVYSVSIPLGATINMNGAAVTIAVMTLAAAHTLGVTPNILLALTLSVIAALAACGASGVAGGSLLLIPMACSLFGISNEVAMQVVGVGFVIGVVQDSFETALNSSGDVIFAATAEYREWQKSGRKAPDEIAQDEIPAE